MDHFGVSTKKFAKWGKQIVKVNMYPIEESPSSFCNDIIFICFDVYQHVSLRL